MTETQTQLDTLRAYVITATPEGGGMGHMMWDLDYATLIERFAHITEVADEDRLTLSYYNVVFPAALFQDKGALTDAIERVTLGEQDAGEGWEVTCNGSHKPKNRHKPAEPVIIRPATVDEDAAVVCPHCGAVDDIAEVDRSIRWNHGSFEIENGKITHAWWSLSDSDHQHEGYVCRSCEGPIEMDVDSESWD